VATTVSLDEYLDLPEKEIDSHELLQGRLVERSCPVFEHGAIQAQCGFALLGHIEEKALGFIAAIGAGFILSPDTMCIPDVCLVQNGRLQCMEVYRDIQRGAPDLAVEVVSSNQFAEDIDLRVQLYLNAGTGIVIIIYPKTRHVMVHFQTGEVRRLGPNDLLELPTLLPDCKVSVSQLFPSLL
jgi:Uma2 family endonuclease